MTKSQINIVLLTVMSIFAPSSVKAENPVLLLNDKEVLALLFRNLDVKLSESKYCENVGTVNSDTTIGDYLSGFWSFHVNTKGKNWLDISRQTLTHGGYILKVMIYRKDGEENWGWGVSFETDKTMKVKKDSFTCLGSG